MNEPTEEQLAVIASEASNIVCIAGPGSGKTATLVNRIHSLVHGRNVPADRIVVITFTNAAANELQRRLQFKVGYVGTLHSYMLRLLQKYGKEIGLKGTITIDPDEKASILRAAESQGYKGTQRDLFIAVEAGLPLRGTKRWTPAELVAVHHYNEMTRTGTLTYNAILKYGIALLWTRAGCPVPTIEHLMVDEYQDSSSDDSKIYGLLPCSNRFFVGDPDQSIYGFRGGEVGNILTLAKDRFTTRYELAANFRSTPMVCEAANRLIAHNQNRIPKMTVSMSHPDHTGSVNALRFPDFPSELSYLAKCIRIDLEIGRSVAVLLRYNVSVEEYAAALESYSIPISKLVATMPEDWPRLKLLVSFLANPDNDYLARQWLIMNVGQEKADEVTLFALNEQKTINDVTGQLPTVIDRDMFSKIIAASKISAASEQKLLTAMSHLETFSIQDILVEIHSGDHSQELGDGVTVTTMHSAKGREWDSVYLPAFEQGIIPGKRIDEIEEDRRVAYVALTRARMCVLITNVEKRKPLWGGFRPEPAKPSQFIAEMGCEQLVKK